MTLLECIWFALNQVKRSHGYFRIHLTDIRWESFSAILRARMIPIGANRALKVTQIRDWTAALVFAIPGVVKVDPVRWMRKRDEAKQNPTEHGPPFMLASSITTLPSPPLQPTVL